MQITAEFCPPFTTLNPRHIWFYWDNCCVSRGFADGHPYSEDPETRELATPTRTIPNPSFHRRRLKPRVFRGLCASVLFFRFCFLKLVSTVHRVPRRIFAVSPGSPGSTAPPPHPASPLPPPLSQLQKPSREVSHDPVAWPGGSLNLIQLAFLGPGESLYP